MERIREAPDKTTRETAYYLLSTTLSGERFLEVVRSHWGVENRLHRRLGVVMNEDQQRNRSDNGPNNLAVLRHGTECHAEGHIERLLARQTQTSLVG